MTQGKHLDQNKPKLQLLPLETLYPLAQVLEYGEGKYGTNNWQHGINYSRIFGSILRHLFTWWLGDDLDNESGLPHLAHAAVNILFLIYYSSYKVEFDDRTNNL